MCTVLTAVAVRRAPASGSAVLVLTSKRGKLLEETSSRMRWPAAKRFAVSGATTSTSWTSPGARDSGSS